MKKFIYKFKAMSAPCELIIYAKEKNQADSAAKAVLLETKRLEKKYNYYKTDSLLSQLNSRLTQEIDSETKNILQRAKQYYQLTNGVFDITIATIKELYRNEKNVEEFNSKKEKLKPFIGCEHFSIKRNKIIFDNKYTKLDLGGFVKEYAVDRAVVVLKKHKITSALINYGGDIYALGNKPDDTKFTIGIKNPQDLNSYALQVSLENQALTTSASYERNYTIGSTTYSHIISKDESTQTPNSVSIVSHNCVESGVYSTSMMIDKEIKTSNRVIIL
jgi:thiamine biosynthesis lipoprotein